MSKILNARLEAIERSHNILSENVALISGFVPLKNRHDKLGTLLTQIFENDKDRNSPTTSLTQGKQEKRSGLAETTMRLAKGAYIWAKDENKTELLADLDLEQTDISSGAENKALALAGRVLDILNQNKTALQGYGIEADDIKELEDAIDDFRKAAPKSRLVIGKNKVKQDDYKAKVKEASDLTDEIENLIISKFLKTNRDLVNNFLAARRIFDPASRSTALSIQVQDAEGKALADVYCDMLQVADEEQFTNLEGKALIEGLKSGLYTLELSKEGYKTHSETIAIKRGQTLKLVVKLEKA